MSEAGAPPPDDDIDRRLVIAEAEARLFGDSRARVQIGRFHVRRRLGVGGMGIVYAAWDPELDREVALKLMRRDRSDGSARDAERMRLEARAMARLAHPHVVPVYEVGLHEGRVFLAMELVRGTTLRAWLAGRSRDWRAVVALFVRIGEGIAAAHAAGLVHRDLKPENVLIDGEGRPRITDFGLVHEPRPDAGTAAYMAPEQRDREVIGPAADQYAFCVALYEALHGHRPDDAVPDETALPPRIARALARGLERQPAARWPSIAALLDALRGPPQRRALRWIAIAVVALVLSAAAIGAVLQMWMFQKWMRDARRSQQWTSHPPSPHR